MDVHGPGNRVAVAARDRDRHGDPDLAALVEHEGVAPSEAVECEGQAAEPVAFVRVGAGEVEHEVGARDGEDPRQRGMELFGAGTHPFASWSTQKLTDAPRYAELIKRTQWWGRQMLIWGVHVHVGVSSPDKVMPVMSSLLNWYPHLLALSSSSPWW